MSITVRGPDGAVITFPAGTPHSVIEREMARHYGHAPEQERDRRSAAVSLSNPKDKRSLGERLGDVFSNTWNTGFIAEGWRAGQDDTADYIDATQSRDHRAAADVNNRFTLNPVRLVSRLAGSVGVLTDSLDGTQDTRRASDASVAQERARRQEFAADSKADPFWEAEGGLVGKMLHGGAALLGTLSATAVDPTSYITGGSSLWVKAGVQGLVAGGTDLLAQSDSTSAGVQNRVDLTQTGLSALAGAGFTGVLEGAGSLVRRMREPRPSTVELDQAMRDELDLSDAVNLPALSLDDWTFRPTLPQGPVSAVNLPARMDAPRAKGPSLDDMEAEAGRAEAGAKATAEERWNGVDWGLAGSPERAKAAMAHLDSLKKFVKPEQVDQFVRWLGRQGDEIGGQSHWNPDVFDFDKLVNDPDQFEELANVMGQIFKPLYDEAGDAAKSWKSVQDRQQLFGIAISDAVKAHADITSNHGVSAKIHALETIAIQHTDHLVSMVADVRSKMKNQTATAKDLSNLASHLQATSMFDAMAGGAKSEVARALNIMKASKQRVATFNDIQQSIDELADSIGGGAKTADDMADALDALIKANQKKGAQGFKDEVRKMRAMGWQDYVSYYLVMGYLTTPATAVRNVIGSVLHAGLSVGERYVAAGVTSPLRRAFSGSKGSVESVTFREANAYVAGIYHSFADASRAGFQAFKQAAPVRENESSIGDSAFQQPFLINKARKDRWKANPIQSMPDMAGAAIFSTLRTLGHRPSVAMDEFAKAMTYRMQLSALSVREASYRSARLKGANATKEFTRVMDAVANRPTSSAIYRAKAVFQQAEETYDPAKNYSTDPTLYQAADVLAAVDLHEMADDHARLMTFQNSGPALKKWEQALGQHRLFKALFVPFLRTPINLVRAGMFDRNPVLFGLLGSNREKFANYTAALRGLDQSLERGGAEADLAMARLVTGIGFMSTAGLMFAGGDLVGKRSLAEEEDGVKSYSIRLGGRWFQYQQLSPVAEMLGLVADMMQTFKDHGINDDEALMGIGGGVLGAITNNITNKAGLQGIGDFWEMLEPSFAYGPSATGQRAGKEIAKKVGSSIVPAIVRNAAHTQDPVMREAHGFLDYIKANIPTLSQSLPERRDWLGLPMIRKDKDGGYFEGLVQPTRVSEQVSDIVRLEVSALAQEDPELRIAARPAARFNEQKITPREHGMVLEYQGQVYRDPISGQNMHEALATLIQSPEFYNMPDPQRATSIKDVVSRHRRLASAAIRSGAVPELREMVNRTGGEKANERAIQEGWDSWQTDANARRYGVTAGDIDAIMNFQPTN